MATEDTLEYGRVTVTAALPVDSYDEDGTPNVLVGAKPVVKADIEFDEALTLGSNLNSLTATRNLLAVVLRDVDRSIEEWHAEHPSEDKAEADTPQGDGPAEGWTEADTDV